MEEYIAQKLKKLALKAYKNNEVPVSCIITKKGKIIAESYNKKENNKNPIHHAEIIAITKACKKLKDWRLNECEMYVTLEPCNMCKEVINQCRIKKVVYILESKNSKNVVTEYEKCDIEDNDFKKILTDFFKQKR